MSKSAKRKKQVETKEVRMTPRLFKDLGFNTIEFTQGRVIYDHPELKIRFYGDGDMTLRQTVNRMISESIARDRKNVLEPLRNALRHL